VTPLSSHSPLGSLLGRAVTIWGQVCFLSGPGGAQFCSPFVFPFELKTKSSLGDLGSNPDSPSVECPG
jgi:hypothetical protein